MQSDFLNQLENTFLNSSNLEQNNLVAQNLGYQNTSNETLYKGSKFIDDVFKEDIDLIFKKHNLDFEAIRTPLFYKSTSGELIEVTDHQAIINNKNNNLLNIPKLQYTTLQLSAIKKLISSIRSETTIESITNIDDKRFIINLMIELCSYYLSFLNRIYFTIKFIY